MATETSGLGVGALRGVEFSLMLTDGPASTNDRKDTQQNVISATVYAFNVLQLYISQRFLAGSTFPSQWSNSL